MKPIELENSVVYAKNQKQYNPLPALRRGDGKIMIAWKFSLLERIKLLFTGKLYHQVMTFNEPLQPILLTLDFPEEFADFHCNGINEVKA